MIDDKSVPEFATFLLHNFDSFWGFVVSFANDCAIWREVALFLLGGGGKGGGFRGGGGGCLLKMEGGNLGKE